jgi:LmbE family N-acetylglucosaminyl deacetylase
MGDYGKKEFFTPCANTDADMNPPEQTQTPKPLRVLVIGAHPDDCEIGAGGLAAKCVKRGDTVKFVSLTNGNAGHHEMGGGPLARRRLEETRRVSEVSGVEYEVFDIADGHLQADLPTREKVIRLIREFRPDILLTHRTNDYHPDHRHTGMLVQDASYLVRVPNICPQTPPVAGSPVILYMRDGFQKPNPFTPDIVVGIDDVFETKLQMLHCHVSQMYEWLPWVGGYEAPQTDTERYEWLRERYTERGRVAETGPLRLSLMQRYGQEQGRLITIVETFEISEYGRGLKPDEAEQIFPR